MNIGLSTQGGFCLIAYLQGEQGVLVAYLRIRSVNWTLRLLHPKHKCVLNYNGCEAVCGNDNPLKMTV